MRCLTEEEQQNELCNEDAQEHRRKIDSAVTNCRGVVAGCSIGKRQRRRVGVGTCNESHEGEIVELKFPTTDESADENGDNGDEEAHPYVVYAVTCHDRAPE